MANNKLLNGNDDDRISFVDDFVTKDKENLTASTTTNNLNKQNVSYLCSLVKEQLKIECRKRGLKTKGNRLELVNWDLFMKYFLLYIFVSLNERFLEKISKDDLNFFVAPKTWS